MNRNNDLYQKVTDEIIAALEKGVIPWVRPWREGEPVVPMNALPGGFITASIFLCSGTAQNDRDMKAIAG